MTNKEIVFGVMRDHPCVSGIQIHDYAFQKYKESITPQAVAGVLRPYTDKGYVASSRNPDKNCNVYWFTEKGKEELI